MHQRCKFSQNPSNTFQDIGKIRDARIDGRANRQET